MALASYRFFSVSLRLQHVLSQHHSRPSDHPRCCSDLSPHDRQHDPCDFPKNVSSYYSCPICTQAVPEHWSLEQHMELLKPLVGLKAKCQVCNKLFGEYRAVHQHRVFCEFKAQMKLSVFNAKNQHLLPSTFGGESELDKFQT